MKARTLIGTLVYFLAFGCDVGAKDWVAPVAEPSSKDLAVSKQEMMKRIRKVIKKGKYHYAYFDNSFREGETPKQAIDNAVAVMMRQEYR